MRLTHVSLICDDRVLIIKVLAVSSKQSVEIYDVEQESKCFGELSVIVLLY